MSSLRYMTEAIESLLSEDIELSEAEGDSEHNPFLHKHDLGTGPRGQHHHKADKWDCNHCGRSGGNTYCDCKGIGSNKGHNKRVTIDTGYKKKYNHEYKKGKYPHWRERRSSRKKKAS